MTRRHTPAGAHGETYGELRLQPEAEDTRGRQDQQATRVRVSKTELVRDDNIPIRIKSTTNDLSIEVLAPR